MGGCGRAEPDVEKEISQLIDAAIAAARSGDAVALAAMISDQYEDQQGRNRRVMSFFLRSLLGRYPQLFVVASDVQVRQVSGELATAQMTLMLAGKDGSRPLPAGLDADRLHLRLALTRYGTEWRVTRADWGEVGNASGSRMN
jgi:hypothetical protein